MTTYFGYPASGADPSGTTEDNNSTILIGNKGYTTGFSCPGSGAQTINEISAWVSCPTISPGNIRLAVYDVSRNLMAQGSAQVAVAANASPSWQGHMSSGAITTTSELIGGTTYYIRYTKDNSPDSTREYYIAGSAGDYGYIDATDLTGGFNDPGSALSSDTAGRYCMRCGVSSAVTNLSIHASECVGSEGMFG